MFRLTVAIILIFFIDVASTWLFHERVPFWGMILLLFVIVGDVPMR